MVDDLGSLCEQRRAVVARAQKRGATHLSNEEQESFDGLGERIEDAEARQSMRSAADCIFSAAQAKNGKTMKQYQLESRVYNQTTAHEGRSFWRDLVAHKTDDDSAGEARARLNEHALGAAYWFDDGWGWGQHRSAGLSRRVAD